MVILRKAQQQDLMVCFLVMGFIFFLRNEYEIQLFPELHSFDLPVWSIGFQYCIGLIFIFVNVIPKYIYFGGAKRHLNDNLMEKKSYFTRNYVRLFMHIISGASLYVFIGIYFLFESSLSQVMPVTFWKWFIIFWDFIHQVTIILMTRNHDGIYLLRTGNVLLAFVKCLFDIELFYCTNLEQIRPFALSVWFYTQGFAGTRLLSFLVAMVEMSTGYEFDALKENWYSIGLSWAQIYVFIMYPRAMLVYCACMFPCAPWFKHELWTRRDNYMYRAMAVSLLPFVLTLISIFVPYGTCPSALFGDLGTFNETLSYLLDDKIFHTVYSIFLIWYNFHYLGMYYKRLPLKGVDFVTPNTKKGGCPMAGMLKRLSNTFKATATSTSGFKCPFSGMIKSQTRRVIANAAPQDLVSTISEPTTQKEIEEAEKKLDMTPLVEEKNDDFFKTVNSASSNSSSNSSTDTENDSGDESDYDSDFSDEQDFEIHPDLLEKTAKFQRNQIFTDFDQIMDQKLAEGIATTVSLEQTTSIQSTESGRHVEVERIKMTKASAARVESMHSRVSFY